MIPPQRKSQQQKKKKKEKYTRHTYVRCEHDSVNPSNPNVINVAAKMIISFPSRNRNKLIGRLLSVIFVVGRGKHIVKLMLSGYWTSVKVREGWHSVASDELMSNCNATKENDVHKVVAGFLSWWRTRAMSTCIFDLQMSPLMPSQFIMLTWTWSSQRIATTTTEKQKKHLWLPACVCVTVTALGRCKWEIGHKSFHSHQ